MSNPGYTRRQEFACTLAELSQYASAVLYEHEALYVKQADGTYAVKIGDGVTPVGDLPYSINYSEINAAKIQTMAARDEAKAIADSIGVVQTAGNSPKAVMSQKAVTEEVNAIKDLFGLPVTLGGGSAEARTPAYDNIVVADGISIKTGKSYIMRAKVDTSLTAYVVYLHVCKSDNTPVYTSIVIDQTTPNSEGVLPFVGRADEDNMRIVLQTGITSGLTVTATLENIVNGVFADEGEKWEV